MIINILSNNNSNRKNNIVKHNKTISSIMGLKVLVYLLFLVVLYIFSKKIISTINNIKDCKSCAVGNCTNCITKDMFFTLRYIPIIIVVLFVILVLFKYGLDKLFDDIFSEYITDYIFFTISTSFVLLQLWYCYRLFHSMLILRKNNCNCIKQYKKRITFLFISGIITLILAINIYAYLLYQKLL